MFTGKQREMLRQLIREEIAEALAADRSGREANHAASDALSKELSSCVSQYLYPLLDLKDKRRGADGLTSSEMFQRTEQWKAVRQRAIDLHGPICMCCGSTEEIQVDHIKPKSEHPELALTVDNLQILCWSCNRKKWKDGSEQDYRCSVAE